MIAAHTYTRAQAGRQAGTHARTYTHTHTHTHTKKKKKTLKVNWTAWEKQLELKEHTLFQATNNLKRQAKHDYNNGQKGERRCYGQYVSVHVCTCMYLCVWCSMCVWCTRVCVCVCARAGGGGGGGAGHAHARVIWAKLQLFVNWLYFLVTRACDIITQLCQTWGSYKNKNENMIWFANWT